MNHLKNTLSYQYGRVSEDSARPLANTAQNSFSNEPKTPLQYGSGYSAGAEPQKKKKKTWLWVLLGVVAIIVILAAVLGGVFGSRAADKNNNKVASNADGSSSAGSSATTTYGNNNNNLIVPTATDAWGNPLYPTTTGSARISSATTIANSTLSCGNDTYAFAGNLTVRNEHPLLMAPSYKWDCLNNGLIKNDHYLSYWNATIFENATLWYGEAPVNYTIDGGLGGSGVLDVAMQVQLRLKHWSYAWKVTNDTKWVDRAWEEILVASGNSSQYFGETGDNWNSQHFLDIGEFTTAFAIAYDWMYDAWNVTQREAIMWTIINLGLEYGYNALNDPYGAGEDYSWWRIEAGNWNCVCNGGMALGALAIMNEDPTGIAAKLLPLTIESAQGYCAQAASPDGTWSETPNYWYFGTTNHVQMAASLLTATGSTQGLLEAPGMALSGLYHMYVTGMQGLFAYGDTGPNKYAATANGLMWYATQYNNPVYSLFQRDRGDAPEPMSMIFYDPQVSGDFWDGLELDHHFDNTTDGWVSMRSSWTTTQGMYVAMKAGALLNHQTHGDLDVGDFVLDALGQRWAGELGSADYLGLNYFSNETQGSERWYYFRKRTEGQNTLASLSKSELLNLQNQNVSTVPTTTFDTTGDVQTALDYTAPNSSTAFFTADMETAYMTPAMRAIRFLNGRRQVLLQDEITVPTNQTVQWRIQTNATITLGGTGNTTATLELGGETLEVKILSPSTASFFVQADARYASDPILPSGSLNADQSNAPAQVLTIELGAGEQDIQVVFNPQWSDFTADDFITPPSVAIADWTLTSHDA